MYPKDVQCCADVAKDDGAEPREINFKAVKKAKKPAKKKK